MLSILEDFFLFKFFSVFCKNIRFLVPLIMSTSVLVFGGKNPNKRGDRDKQRDSERERETNTKRGEETKRDEKRQKDKQKE